MRWIAVVAMLGGCSARPLGTDRDAFTVDGGQVDAARMDAFRSDAAGGCNAPGEEQTQDAVRIAWEAVGGPGAAPHVSWSCDCIEVNGILCLLYDRRDPMRVTWMARYEDNRITYPTRISESHLGYVLAEYAEDLGAVMVPSTYEAGERARRALVKAGY